MTLVEMKKEIVKQIKDAIAILEGVPLYDYVEERLFALEEIKSQVKNIKTVEDLEHYGKRLLNISNEFGEHAKKAKTKIEKHNCLGLKAGYKMGYLIIKTELENETMEGKQTQLPKKKVKTSRKTKN